MEENKNNNENRIAMNILKIIILAVLGFVFVMVVFGLGVWVGQERAEFSFRWAEEYHQNFGGPARGIFGNFPAQGFDGGHGLYGEVLKIDGNDIIVKGQDNIEKTVVVPLGITIMDKNTKIAFSAIAVDDNIVVIGEPDNQGQIQAKFIRVLPAGSSYLQSNRPAA